MHDLHRLDDSLDVPIHSADRTGVRPLHHPWFENFSIYRSAVVDSLPLNRTHRERPAARRLQQVNATTEPDLLARCFVPPGKGDRRWTRTKSSPRHATLSPSSECSGSLTNATA